jgi:GDP-L-fucose synthase
LKVDNFTDANIVFDASKPTMIPKRLIDISKAKRLLDFDPKVSLEEGLLKTVTWYRNSLK